MSVAKTAQADAAFLAAVPVPEGFTAEAYLDSTGWTDAVQVAAVRMTGDGITIRIVMDHLGGSLKGSGHVDFTTSRGAYTLDRRGVDDSFYVAASETPEQVGAVLLEQIKLVEASRARHLDSVAVPGMQGGPWLVTTEQRATISAKLKGGNSHAFTPAGMGIGYQVSTRRSSQFDRALPHETAQFFGVARLFVSALDCD